MNAGAGAAAAAAAEEERRRREEEEMTNYPDADLQEEWEFKIVRCNMAAFKKPEALQQVCAEEATAGWTLLEKFDNSRLRFKRPVSARALDAELEFDPYRTEYGATSGTIVLIVLACTVLVVAGTIGAVLLLHK